MTTASNTNSHNVNDDEDDEDVNEDDDVHHDSDMLVNGNLRFL